MKTRHALLAAILTIVLTLPVFGQHKHVDTTKADMKKHDMSSMMGKPTVDATVEGLHMKVWLMTQKECKEMMQGESGQMMMHGKKEGGMGQVEMMGVKDVGVGMGRDMKVMKLDSLGTSGNTHAMKLDSIGTRKDMKVMRHESMGMNKAMMDSMMAGTHHLRLDVTDGASGKEVANASAMVLLLSPSKKNSSVDLKPMMSHFGGALTLDEKGEYQFTVSVNVGGVSKTTQFQYAVK